MWYIFVHIVILLSALGLVHTYLVYPLLMRWLARGRAPNQDVHSPVSDWPEVAVIMSAYNEEAVIEEKMAHLLSLQYPKESYLFLLVRIVLMIKRISCWNLLLRSTAMFTSSHSVSGVANLR